MEKITARRYQPFRYEMTLEESDKHFSEIMNGLERIAAERGFSCANLSSRYNGSRDPRMVYSEVKVTNPEGLLLKAAVSYKFCKAEPVSHKDRAYVEAEAWILGKDELMQQEVTELFSKFNSHWFWKYF